MKILTNTLLLTLISLVCYSQVTTSLGDRASTQTRVQKVKQCTGKVLLDNVKSGTGFFVSSDGIFITNWHVIFNKSTKIDSIGRILSSFSIVNSKNDTLKAKVVLKLNDDFIVQNAIYGDYCVLKVDGISKANFLKLGSFADSYEGAPVYTCGFPLDVNEPFITLGIMSSFFKQSTKIGTHTLERDAAWLDMTTNKGNSGGPLILIGDKPEDDKVIGITSFITTPNYQVLENLNQYVQEMEKRGSIELMGINFLQYIKLINETANSNSVGISGCVSIDKVSSIVKPYIR